MVSTSLPPGIEQFNPTTAAVEAGQNVIVMVFGDSKTGKTHFAVRCERPLYIAYLDPNTNLPYHLLKAEKEGFVGEVFMKVIRPIEYDQLTEKEAEKRVKEVEQFANWARAKALRDVADGKPAGTFVLDGATMLKGYVEKWKLGESQTFGWRAKAGERGGPSIFDNVKRNAKVKEMVAAFAGSPLDVVWVWEGRPVYIGGERTARFKTSMPGQVPFAVNAEVETTKVFSPLIVDNVKIGSKVTAMVRIGYNAYGLHLEDRMMPAMGFKGLKELFLVDVPKGTEESTLAEEQEYEVASTAGPGPVKKEDEDA